MDASCRTQCKRGLLNNYMPYTTKESEYIFKNIQSKIVFTEGKNVELAAIFKNETIHETFSMKVSIDAAEINVIEIALKRIEQKGN